VAGLTAASVSAIAGELRSLHTTLGGWTTDLESMRTTARGSLDDADGNWGGPRSLRTLAAVRDYLGCLDPVLEAVGPAQEAMTSLAAEADEIAGALDHADGLDASARALRGTGLPEVAVDAVGFERAADRVRAAAEIAWVAACAALTAAVDPSLAVIRGFATNAIFTGGEATTSAEYLFVIAQFSALRGIPVAELDPTGQVAAATDDWIELLSGTEIGAMYFMVLESMKDADIAEADWNLSGEDLALAAQDPEALRALFVQWGAAHGCGVRRDDPRLPHRPGHHRGDAARRRGQRGLPRHRQPHQGARTRRRSPDRARLRHRACLVHRTRPRTGAR
jgi:hypothetical protein